MKYPKCKIPATTIVDLRKIEKSSPSSYPPSRKSPLKMSKRAKHIRGETWQQHGVLRWDHSMMSLVGINQENFKGNIHLRAVLYSVHAQYTVLDCTMIVCL